MKLTSMRLVLVFGFLVSLLLPSGVARAEAGLQVTPQKYQEIISGTTVRSGFVDVSNPGDSTVRLESLVQGFRQSDLAGNLEFFDDPILSEAIKVDLTNFELGPREAVRVAFSVNPVKLPKGGVYGAIFFRTIPPTPSSNTSYVAESAKVGTLLILENGTGEHIGKITKFSLPIIQFGGGITGVARYRNTDRNPTASAFAPQLSTKVLFWGRSTSFIGPFVLPQSEREFAVNKKGSYFGLLPVSLRDSASSQVVTRWALVCTGWYQLGLIIVVIFGLYLFVRKLISRYKRSKKPATMRRNLDGIIIRKK